MEDAAQGVCARYKGRYLGTIGDLGVYSFHETKNFYCGEGGALLINDVRYADRAEILDRAGDVFEIEGAVIVDVGAQEDVGRVGGQALLVEIPGLHPWQLHL